MALKVDKIDKCFLCKEKAEYYIKSIKLLTTAEVFVCEKHQQEIVDAKLRSKWF